ncbi:MAG: hypothetical protein ABJH68_17265 [Ilumatobacter sp.]|uniref:hypothetical protein n=1 Tax=Ilumatobacter sp. TaxID=1967498 RepID=UPI0032985C23
MSEPAGDFVEVADGDTRWRFEREFLTSNWRCTFGNGCKGILREDATALNQGCCSLGAHFGDGPAGQEEARQLSAYVSMLTPDQWQFHDVGTTEHLATPASDPPGTATLGEDPIDSDAQVGPRRVPGFYDDAGRTRTRVFDGACVFLNRPGFDGGEGCALHIAALAHGESPTEWKPSVCWQLPLRVDWALVDDTDPHGPETATVRRWSRADWGAHGTTMAWCCTERSEGGEAYSGGERVVDSLADELQALAGDAVYVELRKKFAP